MSHDHLEPAPGRPLHLKPALLVLLLSALAAIAIGLAVRARDYHELVAWTKEQELPTVQLITPKLAADQHGMTLPGHLEAWISAPIHAQVSGYLKSWSKDIGSSVQAGETLAVIDTPELDQQYEHAKAVLARARANAQLAEITSQRWQHLLTSNSVSKQETDEKRSEAAVAEANVLSAKADVDRFAAQESFRHLTAPFSGKVTVRNTDIGDLVSANNQSAPPLFTVADTSKMRLYVSIPQNYATSLKPDMAVTLSVPEHPGKTYTATLIGSSGAVNQASGALLAQFEAANPQGALLPGDYADVQLPLAPNGRLVTVPATVLLFRAAGPQVAVLGSDNKVVLRNVHVAMDLGDALTIDRGMQPGDRIIDHPPDSLSQGDAVRLSLADERNTHDAPQAK